jgi:hypothetical protein
VLEVRAPVAEVGDALYVAQPLLAAAQAVERGVECARDVADLVAAPRAQPHVEVAAACLLGHALDLPDRLQEVARRELREIERDRERDQSRERAVAPRGGERRMLGSERGGGAQLERGEGMRDAHQPIFGRDVGRHCRDSRADPLGPAVERAREHLARHDHADAPTVARHRDQRERLGDSAEFLDRRLGAQLGAERARREARMGVRADARRGAPLVAAHRLPRAQRALAGFRAAGLGEDVSVRIGDDDAARSRLAHE